MSTQTKKTSQKTNKKYSEFLLQLLRNRGIIEPDDVNDFLNPSYDDHLHDPTLLHDMDKAVQRIITAIENKEKIIIYTDYDADGIPGAVIFSDFFKKIGYKNFEIYIPHRHDEGYGLHHDAIVSFIKEDVDLLITVDLGITATDEVAYANEHNMDVIITDHHLPDGDSIPDAVAVVNPKLGDYSDPMLCGAAVAWKVVCVLIDTMRENEKFADKVPDIGWEKWLLDMVGIATLSDMVPLQNENRVLAWYGLIVLRRTRRVGLVTLLKKLYMKKSTLIEDDITFMITPRINAASRMAHPTDAFKLLATDDVLEAQMMTEHLMQLNDKRKQLVAQTMREAKKKLQKRTIEDVIVIGSPDWQAGILGLVAGRIAEEFERPTFVWSRENEHIKGSCRSYGTCDVHALMTDAAEGTFVQCGGHKEAGGFTVDLDAVHDLEASLLSVYEKEITHEEDIINHDAAFPLSMVNQKTYRDLRNMAPFGVGNPQPQFLFENVEVVAIRQFGKQKNHIEVSFMQNDITVKGITFFAEDTSFTVTPNIGKTVSCAAHIEQENFRGRRSIRLRIIDIISSSNPNLT